MLITSIFIIKIFIISFLTFLIKTNYLISCNMVDLIVCFIYWFIPDSYTYFLAETSPLLL